ncbi:MAG: SAM-dependent methyltransferase [Sneathiella sp.]|nr:MAG: SAM-dependent methyltransferase [Sneathiella sp.]
MDRRQYTPSSARNRGPILQALRERLPAPGTFLEIASGSGEHAVHFAPHLADHKWQASNHEQDQLDSVYGWLAHSPAPNLLPPLKLDATAPLWPVELPDYAAPPVTGVFNANMIHIAPWPVCQGMMAGAGRVLVDRGRLFLYGPYKVGGIHTAETNAEFDLWLKSKNPDFAIRDQDDVIHEAATHGLVHLEAYPMPANNFLQIFEKRA